MEKMEDWEGGFRANIGRIMHHTPQMEAERAAHKEELRARKQEIIERKRAQIAQLQAEIDEEEK